MRLLFSIVLAALGILCALKGLRIGGRIHHLWPFILLPVLASLGCRMSPNTSPVPVEGAREAVRALSGEWSGRYWSQETGRHGTIQFLLPERADTGYGEVDITFSPSLHLLRAADDNNDVVSPKPCTTIAIRVVRVENDRVEGTMKPYWDPDCDCRAQTVFEGTLSGDKITGSFSTHRESADRRVLTGKWSADRSS
jgi:hypothetical protein